MSSVSIEEIGYKPYPKANRYFQIGWLPRLNVRREYGNEREMRETRDNLSTGIGWDSQYPAIAEPATDEEVAEILKFRETVYNDLKQRLNEKDLPSVQIPEDGKNVSIDGRDYLMAKIAVFEHWYLDPKGSKLRTPLMTGTTGNRRGSCILDAGTVQLILARRKSGDMKLQPSAAEGQVTEHISIIVPDTANNRFPDVAVRKQAQIRENETKTSGFKRMTDAERLEAVLDLVENHGKSQSDVRNSGYGAVLGLRLYFACVIDVYCRQQAASTSGAVREAWKGIHFLTRLMAPQYKDDKDREAGRVNSEWLDFAKFQQRAFQGDDKIAAMGLMCEITSKFDKENKRRTSLKVPLSPLDRPTPESVKEWIAKAVMGADRQNPQLPRQQIQALSDTNPNPFVKDAMKAVDKNNVDLLHVARDRAQVCQYVYGASAAVHERLLLAVSGLQDLDEDTQLTLLQQFGEEVNDAVEVAEANKPKGEEGASETEDASAEHAETSEE